MAINAFKFASQLDFDYTLKEDAFFNVVKLVYQNQRDEETTYNEGTPLECHTFYIEECYEKEHPF